MTDHIQLVRDGAVLAITFARPDKKNALSSAMYEALIVALNVADRDEEIGAILFVGSGGAFTAGNDIGDFLAGTRAAHGAPAFRFIKALANCDTPMVAAVEGVAVGVGTTMLLHCDLVYAAPGATFRMPFVDLGLVPEAASSLLVPRRFGAAKAAELLLLGEPFDGAEAYRLGLVNAVVPNDALLAHARSKAQALAAKPRAAIAATRRLLRGDRAEVLARMEEESAAFAKALTSPEAKRAFEAFLAKSKPAAAA